MFDGPNTPARHVDIAIPDASWEKDEPRFDPLADVAGQGPSIPSRGIGPAPSRAGSTEAYWYFHAMVLGELDLSEQDVEVMTPIQRARLDAVVEPEVQDRMMAALLAEAGAPVTPTIESRSRNFKNAYHGLGELDLFLDVFGDGRTSLALAEKR